MKLYICFPKQQTEITTGDDLTGFDTGGSNDIYGDKVAYVKHLYADADNIDDPGDYGD